MVLRVLYIYIYKHVTLPILFRSNFFFFFFINKTNRKLINNFLKRKIQNEAERRNDLIRLVVYQPNINNYRHLDCWWNLLFNILPSPPHFFFIKKKKNQSLNIYMMQKKKKMVFLRVNWVICI
jgi:hypothetical protein